VELVAMLLVCTSARAADSIVYQISLGEGQAALSSLVRVVNGRAGDQVELGRDVVCGISAEHLVAIDGDRRIRRRGSFVQ
jgi:hypothetical protein